MKFSDWGNFTLVLLIFALIHLFLILAVKKDNIKKNWESWRCNPIIMPFVTFFGYNASTNFKECIKQMQTNYMDDLLKPINGKLDGIYYLGSILTTSFRTSYSLINKLQYLLAEIFKRVNNAFHLIVIEFQKTVINIKDIFAKIGGMFTILTYILEGIGITITSISNSPVGKAIDKACFDPNTKVKLINNELVAMKDIKLNSKLKNGSIVMSVMKINNLDFKDNVREKMYEISGGEDNENILVTGSHLVYDPIIKQFVEVKNLRGITPSVVSHKNCSELSCLITSDHIIPIGKFVFHDWEDNNGSKSKSL